MSVTPARKLGYHQFVVQPTMLMDIQSSWDTLNDYIGSLRSKYKVRTRRTFKKLKGVEKVDMDLDLLVKWSERMHEMYKSIATQASFNLFILDKLYFHSLKKELNDKCKVIGYFLNGNMIGFFTIIYNVLSVPFT